MRLLHAATLSVALLAAARVESAQPAAHPEARDLVVQIRIDSDYGGGRQGAALSLDNANVAGRLYGSARSGSQSSVQQLTVLEGHEARFSVGQSILLPLYQVTTGVNGSVVSETALLRDVGSGFTVTPRLRGDRVIAEISVHHDMATTDPLASNVDRLSTTVSGRLGEWIRIGAAQQQESRPQAGGTRYGTNAGTSDRQLWLKVDPAP